MKRLVGMVGVLALLVALLSAVAKEQGPGKRLAQFYKPYGVIPLQSLIDVNNLTSWVRRDGFHDWVIESSWNGTFPKGTAGFVFSEGIIWGGKVSDGGTVIVRVGGNAYSSGTVAGRILTDAAGNVTGAEDPNDKENVRLWRVRPDYKTADLTDDAVNFYQKPATQVTKADAEDLRAQYEMDWNTWPWQKGAPFDDKNGDGRYDPAVDVPGIPGADQTIWTVYNDLDEGTAKSFYGSPSIGLEVQETHWAYARTDALGNVVFKRVRLIYKGTPTTPRNAVIDSMFVVQWSDPDLGQYTDDFAGCDTTLGLGYVYNSSSRDNIYFDLYGLAPPAGGYDFLQGVLVPGAPTDTAIFDFKKRPGFRNLSMSVFGYFVAGGRRSDPTRGGPYEGTLQWYNLMAGYEPRPAYPARVPFTDFLTGKVTKFEVPGDPVTGQGWIDGARDAPGDRRIVLSTGPFTMARGDTQEVVLALVGGLGRDYLSSISVLKFNDGFAQFAYDKFFSLPAPPTAPKVNKVELDGEIVLDWGSDLETVSKTEQTVQAGFVFEGYNVYQLPSDRARLEEGVRLATFDVPNLTSIIIDKVFDEASGFIIEKPVQFGTNSGVKRYFRINRDRIRNRPLANGQTYYFAVTAYSFNPGFRPEDPFRTMESAPVIISVTPQSTKPGVRYGAASGDTLKTIHRGISDGRVWPIVIDPGKLSGHTYKVTFDTLAGETVWSLIDSTANKVLLANQKNQSGDDNYSFTEGLQVKVLGPPPGVKDWEIPSGTRRWTWAGGADGFGFEGFNGAIGWASPASVFGSGVPGVPAHLIKNVLLKLAAVDANGNFDPNDPNVSYGYRYGRNFASPPARPEFAPFIVNPSGGYAYQDFTKSVPLAAFDVEAVPPRRLAVGHLENNVPGGMVDGKWMPPVYTEANNTAASGPREWLWIFDADYSETPNPAFQVEAIGNPLPIMYWLTVARRSNAPWEPTDEFLILANHVNSQLDVFVFNAPAPTVSTAAAQADVEKINVFPNPYYGFNVMEQTRLQKYVTFNHLPEKATLRIFNLAGVLVRRIDKNDPSQFLRWDLRNQNNLPVASGIYVVHIEMPAVGKTKILKLAVIQEEPLLRVY